MNRIVNGAPMTILQGTEDISGQAVTPEPEAIPQFLSKVYLYAQKGRTGTQLLVGNSLALCYGDDTFDLRSKYANHATLLCTQLNARANAMMVERLKPKDAGPNASLRLSIDVLPLTMKDYERNTDGSFKTDGDGERIELTDIQGVKVKWIISTVEQLEDGGDDFGTADQTAGDQVDPISSTQSVRYPIVDLVVPDFGEDGNRRGIRFWAPTAESQISINPSVLESAEQMAYPFRMACVYKASSTATPKIVPTLYAENYVDVCLKEGVIDKKLNKQLDMAEVFIQAYQDLENPGFPPIDGPFGNVHLYRANIAELQKQFYDLEFPFADSFSDFTGDEGEEFRFNMLGGVSSANVPYHSYVIDYSQPNSVRLSENSTHYAAGGSDGTMNDELFAELVSEAVVEYGNPLSELLDTARYPESVIIDSGFPLDTKFDLLKIIAERKDTFCLLGTAVAGEKPLTASEDSSVALALKTRSEMYPESDYFGTPVMRALVMGRSGMLLGSQYKKRLPFTIEIAAKSAEYMGAGNRQWKADKNFDHGELAKIKLFDPETVNVRFTPAIVRNKDWANGLNWAQSYGRSSLFVPALKTVYSDDTSVLNSYFTAMACCTLQKVGEKAWRDFSGASSLTPGELKQEVEDQIKRETKDLFHGRFQVIPEVYFTEADVQRGFSWGLRIILGANNMTTVMSFSVQARRMSDMPAAT